ncbi:MAG: ABC transporter permease [Firmicutes bacterium HGW-Firmicutes-21]|nr:MAG: ABC transporter permease [Firmicutes bacterium HGW-Firmicutes-21]
MRAMRALNKSFVQFLRETWEDIMLAVMLFVPVIAGVFFRFVLPQIEVFLTDYFSVASILSPYYLLFDSFLCMITPLMFSFVSAMVILGEADNGLSAYLAVTPLGKSGYLISRLGIPTLLAVLYGSVNAFVFSLTGIAPFMSILLSVMGGFISVTVSMLIVSVSSNKVEGMALSKLSSLLLLGLPLPFFINDGIQYLAAFLPSFWMGKFIYLGSAFYVMPFLAVSTVWSVILYERFIRKII